MFFKDSNEKRRKAARKQIPVAERLEALASSPIPNAKSYTLMSYQDMIRGDKTTVFDVESYPNYFCVSFKCLASKKVICFEIVYDEYLINDNLVTQSDWINNLTYCLYRWCNIGFNSASYDIPICFLACNGVTVDYIFEASQNIIRNSLQLYQFQKEYGIKINKTINHIDLIEVAPIQASLKIYSGRLHCERMQDLPYRFDSVLDPVQIQNVKDYNINDLDNTELLFNELRPFITMREQLSIEYGQDLRSKSDAQVAECIITTELRKLGPLAQPKEWKYKECFYYKPPEWLSFENPVLRQLKEFLSILPIEISGGGKPVFPENILELSKNYNLLKIVDKSIQIDFDTKTYVIGIGGLHSNEKSNANFADENYYIIDRDVASYYPYILLNNRYFPTHLGEVFLSVYNDIVKRRLKLKKEKNPLEAGLKIAINGIFGKLGNIFSAVYSPDLLVQVTITGQLALLMQIEMVSKIGVSAISANTDGVVYKCRKTLYRALEYAIMQWESLTGFTTEETRYEALLSRDVNNYIALKTDYLENKETKEIVWLDGVISGVKTKGVYSEKGSAQNSVLSKNPEILICSLAVQEFLSKGTPIIDTITSCTDLRKFVSVRHVKGGAEKDGIYLGKAIRWYYSVAEKGTINYAATGNKVPNSEGAKPLMILPNYMPSDIDIDWYYNKAMSILYEIGYYKKQERQTLL